MQVGCPHFLPRFCFTKTRRTGGGGYSASSLWRASALDWLISPLQQQLLSDSRCLADIFSRRYRHGTHWSSPPFGVSATSVWQCVVVSNGTRAFVQHSHTFLWRQGRAHRARRRVCGGDDDGLRFFCVRDHSLSFRRDTTRARERRLSLFFVGAVAPPHNYYAYISVFSIKLMYCSWRNFREFNCFLRNFR